MKITFLDGPYKGKKFEINSPKVTIGRDGGNQLILDTDGVSRCHAEFQQLPDGSWIVRDLNSTNGVKIAGVRIDGTAVLNENFEVTIGENRIKLLVSGMFLCKSVSNFYCFFHSFFFNAVFILIVNVAYYHKSENRIKIFL
jgi:pSer/pThr/pTyr-binding forkhead associated (FHA) protein